MAIISPVSDLRNYNTVLEQVSAGSPVYLTVNGRGRFTIRDIADDEEFEKAKAMLRLMCELNTGIRSGEEEGWGSEDDVRAHFHSKRKLGLNTPRLPFVTSNASGRRFLKLLPVKKPQRNS